MDVELAQAIVRSDDQAWHEWTRETKPSIQGEAYRVLVSVSYQTVGEYLETPDLSSHRLLICRVSFDKLMLITAYPSPCWVSSNADSLASQ